MSEIVYIKDQKQLEHFLEVKGADPFFTENVGYYEFKRCEYPIRFKEGIPLHMAEKYYNILKELSDFMKRVSEKYDLPNVIDFYIEGSDSNDPIYVEYEIKKDRKSAIFKFTYDRREGKWYLYSIIYKHEIGYYHHIMLDDIEGICTDKTADFFIVSTNKNTDILTSIDDEDIMDVIDNEIKTQIKIMVDGVHKIADDINNSYK